MAPVTLPAIEAAGARLESIAIRTPLDRSTSLADRSGAAAVGLKLENMQRTGSFKIRGAYNRMAQLSDEERSRGVITASAGNHGQGVALAGERLDIETTIVVPEITPAVKIAAARGYGADVRVHGDIYERSYERALALAEEEGRTFVHPFDDERIIAGQGTIGLELGEQLPAVETVLVSVGGGGLISGIATAMDSLEHDVRVIGVQPVGAAHAGPSLERGEIVELDQVDTIADGIADTRLLETTFEVMRERVDDVVTVTDRQLAVAVALLAERAKTVVEPAGAAPVAALLGEAVDVADEHVAAIVSGGNADLTTHADIVRTGLRELGRYATVTVAVAGWPDGLTEAIAAIDERGAVVDDVRRARGMVGVPPNRTPVELGIEGSDAAHLREVVERLDALDRVTVVEHSPSDESAGSGTR